MTLQEIIDFCLTFPAACEDCPFYGTPILAAGGDAPQN
jgi:hypothetical protein